MDAEAGQQLWAFCVDLFIDYIRGNKIDEYHLETKSVISKVRLGIPAKDGDGKVRMKCCNSRGL